ncbi:MAG: LPS export ABC transporter periplasmic protein LptC [Cellvibrionaceae bacterium]
MIKSWLAPLVLIALTILFLMFWDTPPQSFLKPQIQPQSAVKYPSNILENTVNREYDDQGQLKSIFESEQSRYFQINPKRRTHKDYAELTAPKLTLLSANAPPWQITADEGKAKKNGAIIHLWGNVHIWQKDALGQVSELTTPYLVVKPEQQYAETDKPVIIVSAGSTTHAVGMKAFLRKDTIKLLSKVRGIHEP